MKKIILTLAIVFFISEVSADFRVLEQIRSKASARAKNNAAKKKATKAKNSASKNKKLKKTAGAKSKQVKEIKPKERITSEALDVRNNLAYLPNEDTPFTGKHLEYHPNGKKYVETKYKDGKKNGVLIMWDEYEHKIGEINYADGQRVD